MFRYMIIIVLFVVAASPVVAVDTLQVTSPDPVLEAWRWTTFDRSSGLAGNVRDIFEDREGNIWFATDQGAQRYDGYRWTTYKTEDGLAHNQVRTVYQTRDGAIWFGTWGGGISRFDPSASSEHAWTTYTTEDGLASNWMWWKGLVQTRDGTLWAGFWNWADTTGTQAGISRFDGKSWTTVEVPVGLPRPNILDIHEASDGSIWFATWGQDNGVLRFDGSGWRRYTTAEGLAGNDVVQIMESRDGSLWVACWGDGISRFDGRQWRSYTVRDGLPEGRVFGSVWQTADGSIWAGGNNGTLCRLEGDRWKAYTSEEIPHLSGLRLYVLQSQDGSIWFYDWGQQKAFRFDGASKKWISFAHPDPLVGGYLAPDGSVWFGTKSGAVRYDGANWLRYTAEDGVLDAPIINMARTDDGSLWFLAGEFENLAGVSRYHNGTWSRYTAEEIGLDDVSENGILQAKDGSFWLAGAKEGSSAVSRYDGQTWRVYTVSDGLVGKHLRRVVQAANGDLWFGTGRRFAPARGIQEGDGIIRYDGERWTSYTTEDGLSHNRIYGLLAAPDGTIWVGTRIGLSWFDGTSWNSYTQEDGLPAEKSVHLQVIDGDLWFTYGGGAAGSGGVTRYDGKTWRTYTTQDGLTDNFGYDLYHATDGTLWHATQQGVSRFDGNTWTGYTVEDGLPDNYIRRIWQSQDGRIWFRTDDGQAGTFSPDKIGPETMLEPALNEISSAGNILVRWSGRDQWDSTPPQEMRYQWRMDDGDWSPWGMRADFTFTELSSGDHRLEVRAMDGEGNVEATPAFHAFVVEAPWWKNPWVLGGTVVLLGLVGVQTGRVVRRDRRLQQTNTALSDANKELFGLNEDLQQKTEDLDQSNQALQQKTDDLQQKTEDLEQKTEDLDQSNQELTVEAALERVRAKALEMKESEELSEVSETLFQEFQDLGFPVRSTQISVDNEETDTSVGWVLRPGIGVQSSYEVSLSWTKNLADAFGNMFAARKRGETQYTHVWEKEEYDEAMRRFFERVDPATFGLEPGQTFPFGDSIVTHYIFHTHGFMAVWVTDPLSDPDLAVAKRFADVFGFAYDRFLELQEKEERNRELEEANRAMSEANKDLFQANQALQRDSAVERIRGEVQAMEQASDFERVLSLLSEDLKTVGLSFDTCGIEVLDEPVDKPTLPYFEEHGYRYTAYTIDPDGTVASNSYHISAPFRPVDLEILERFIAGEPWQGRSGQNAIVEVPASNYGRLRITSSDRQDFTEEDIESLQDFASAIALGYARYLDIREIQEQTQKKSAFLASMSHDLRTPMNAIKGFTNLVLGRRSENLTERQRGNLEKVTQASDQLLAMINDLLDVSKIEAGQMDVNVSTFDVGQLVDYCVSTVSPLVQEGVTLSAEIDEGIGEAHTDEVRLRRMLINLASNAIKFTDSGRVTVQAMQDDEYLVLSVSDTGKGIPEDELATIFDEYRQVEGSDREHKGTGLGLSITKQFAELLGGSIRVQSEVGKGSVFTVRVPVVYKEG